MGIDINNVSLANSTGFVVNFSGNQLLKLGPTGILQRYNVGQTMFRAGNSGSPVAAAIGGSGTFNIMPFNMVNVNVGSCFNTSNHTFTAPVAGVYLFTASCYCNGAGASWYVHAMFYVNGSATARRPSGPLYRISGYGHTDGYIDDTESYELMSLLAGDYVSLQHFPSSAGCTHVPQYARFEGYLLG